MTRKIYFFFFLLIIGFNLCAQEGNLDFVQNNNQFPQPVRFKAMLPGGAVFLRSDGFTFNYFKEQDIEHIHELKHQKLDVSKELVNFHAYHVRFSGANANAEMSQEGKLPYVYNYFLGNDPKHWAGNVPLYKRITWHNIYKDIDAVVYSKGQSMKYDFVVKPGADPTQIELAFDGVKPELMKDGSMLIHTSVNTITEQAPYVYQTINGKEVPVKCNYVLKAGNIISFEFPEGYQKAYALTIDPVLVFSTFSGSTATTFGFSATYDLDGNLYAGGECFGVGWPSTTGAFQVAFGGSVDAGINKYSTNGTSILYSTYYGGSGTDLPNNMIVNANGELVICGSTTSANLPVTTGCYDNSLNGFSDIYIARFNASGNALAAATYIGGNGAEASNTGALSPNYGDANRGEVFTASGNIYIASSTTSSDFPVTTGAVQSSFGGAQDGVVCKLDAGLTTLQYSTYLGGTGNDAAFALVLNSTGEIVVCGGTASANFPTTIGSYHATAPGGTDGFVSIINTSTGLTHSTFLGTTAYDHAFKVQIDPSDNVFVMGQTATTSNYPVSTGVYSVTNGDIFIHKLNPTLTAGLISTRMGNTAGAGFVPTAFMHDVCGNTYLSGFNASGNSPLSVGAYQTTPGSFWLGALGPDFTTLLYGTFFGPFGSHVDGGTSRFDPQGIIYHSACTADPSFPTSSTAVHPTKLTGSYDIASYKFNMDVGAVTADFALANNANDTGCADYQVAFTNNCVGATDFNWDFGDGGSSTLAEPTHIFSEGEHIVTLIASRQTGCNLADTATMRIFVKPTNKPLLSLQDTFLCDPKQINIQASVSNISSLMGFHWEPVNAIVSNPNQASVTVNPALSSSFTVYVSNAATGECVDTAMGIVNISLFDYSNMTALPLDTTVCPGDTVLVRAFGGTKYLWSPDEDIASITAPFTNVWPSTEMAYKVLIENDSNCKIERTVLIHFYPSVKIDAGDDQDIKTGESTTLEGRALGTILWSPAGSVHPSDIMNPTVTPDKTTTYYLTVISPEGCVSYDSVTVHVTDAVLPNAFSPNGDGLNDVFKMVPKDERVRLKDFSVYNRFGQKVFFTRDITEGWNGYFNGKVADLGTYFYLVRYVIGARTYSLKGDVTLMR